MPLPASRLKKASGVLNVPDAVADQVDLHALALLVDQRLREALADLVVLDDVGLHVDVVARGRDRREHGVVGGRAVLQQHHVVAGGQRTADDGLLERQVALEDVGRLTRGAQSIENGLALRRRQGAARALQLHRLGRCVAPGRARWWASCCNRQCPATTAALHDAAKTPTPRSGRSASASTPTCRSPSRPSPTALKSTGIALGDVDHVIVTGLQARAVKARRRVDRARAGVPRRRPHRRGRQHRHRPLGAAARRRPRPGRAGPDHRRRAARRRLRRVGPAHHRRCRAHRQSVSVRDRIAASSTTSATRSS